MSLVANMLGSGESINSRINNRMYVSVTVGQEGPCRRAYMDVFTACHEHLHAITLGTINIELFKPRINPSDVKIRWI